MLSKDYYYNQTIKKSVALFGSLFNNITIGRQSGVLGSTDVSPITNVERVPIAYGPRQKWLDRIQEQANLETPKVAIKVPRMSFEITTLTYDSSIKLNKLNTNTTPITGDTNHYATAMQSVPYIISMDLNIFGRNQDDVLQIMEQILPEFTPEYTLTVKDMEGPGLNADVPIILKSIQMTDTFEGAEESTRRALIYTLNFDIKVRFTGPVSKSSLIKFTEVALILPDYTTTSGYSDKPAEYVNVHVGSSTDTPDNYTVVSTVDPFGFSSF